MSVATKSIWLPLRAISTFERIGNVWRRSIIPDTACSGLSKASRLIFTKLTFLSLMMMMMVRVALGNYVTLCITRVFSFFILWIRDHYRLGDD
jgi:hypothetical protein